MVWVNVQQLTLRNSFISGSCSQDGTQILTSESKPLVAKKGNCGWPAKALTLNNKKWSRCKMILVFKFNYCIPTVTAGADSTHHTLFITTHELHNGFSIFVPEKYISTIWAWYDVFTFRSIKFTTFHWKQKQKKGMK